ncbi:MAG: transglycosylase SLT domain-containing protein [Candidatus Aenigmatarchaeota archaeon]
MILEHEEILIILFTFLAVGLAILVAFKFLESPGMPGSITPYPVELPAEPISRDAQKLAQVMEHCKNHPVGDRRCNCGERCQEYANYILQYSGQYGIPDPLLVLSIIMQESSCNSEAVSPDGNDCGIMQVNVRTWSKEFEGLTCDALKDPKVGIEKGIWILAYYYDYAIKHPETCKDRINLDNWQRAVWMYNTGPGCVMQVKNYLNQVMERYAKLKEIYESLTIT